MSEALATEIKELAKARKISVRQALRSADLGDTYLRDLRNGKSKDPKTGSLSKLAYVLGVTHFRSVGQPEHARKSALGERFEAAIYGRWDTLDEALPELDAIGVDRGTLNAVVSGSLVPPPMMLRQLSGLTGCPIDWLLSGGSMEGMHWAMNARISIRYPHLARRSLEGPAEGGESQAEDGDA